MRRPRARLCRFLAGVTLCLLSSLAAGGAVVPWVGHQGKLTNASGTPQNGNFDFVFSIWDAASGGTRLWGPETQNDVSVTNGLYTVLVGTMTPITITFDVPCWLEIAVEGQTLTPRQLLASSPSAFRCAIAESVSEKISLSTGVVGSLPVTSIDAAAPDATKFLRGDGTWVTPSGAGDMAKAVDGAAIAASTTTLGSRITAVQVSTGTLMPWSNKVSLSTGVVGALSVGSISAAGSAGSTTFLRGDGQWAVPSGAGDMTRASDGAAIAVATTTLGTRITAVQVSTGSKVSLSADVVGNLPVDNLASGSGASVSTFWCGNGTWVSVNTLATGSYENIRVGTATTVADGAIVPGKISNGVYNLATTDLTVSTLTVAASLAVNGYGFSVASDTATFSGKDFLLIESSVTARQLNTAGADLAEKYAAAELLEPGDVVVISETVDLQLQKATMPYDTRVAGVISTAPGTLLASTQSGYALALAGRVPVKVSAENGAIRRGDLLTTSSLPGHAMKLTAAKPGAVIGKALQEFSSGTGSIMVLIALQ